MKSSLDNLINLAIEAGKAFESHESFDDLYPKGEGKKKKREWHEIHDDLVAIEAEAFRELDKAYEAFCRVFVPPPKEWQN